MFRWLDGLPSPSSSNYVHWGTNMPDGVKEPNNASPRRNEFCAAANYSQSFDSPFAWGWADNPCTAQLPFVCKAQPPGSAFGFVSPTSRSTYILNTTALPFVEAQYTCNIQGGHLVYYSSLEEEREVEQYFVSSGMFIPSYHRFYWVGYKTQDWPNFVWINNDSRADSVISNFTHWGIYYPDLVAEPNNIGGQEFCVGANATVMPDDGVFGWGDENCNIRAPFICKITRACRAMMALCAGRFGGLAACLCL